MLGKLKLKSLAFIGQRSFAEILPRTQQLIDGILSGSRSHLSRGITLTESKKASDIEQANFLLNECLKGKQAKGSKSFRVGIAGPPGAGKSTFIEALGTQLAQAGTRVAVLAIDPSSVRSGGSILGDMTRMVELSVHENAYVRPSPSRCTLGGVAEATNDVASLCEACDYNIILVETVGLGQSEVAVDDTVDMVMLVVPPANGDELQGVKKGIVEISDLVVVNKSDGDFVNAAKKSQSDFTHALHMIRHKNPNWEPKVRRCSAIKKGESVSKVWEVCEEFNKTMSENGEIEKKRSKQRTQWMWDQLKRQVLARVAENKTVSAVAQEVENRLNEGVVTSRQAAKDILDAYFKTGICIDEE